MTRVNLSVTVDDEHVASTGKIAEQLQSAGLVVEKIVPRAGAIFGWAEEALVETIGGYEGVQEVRPERGFQLPPMSRNIPQ